MTCYACGGTKQHLDAECLICKGTGKSGPRPVTSITGEMKYVYRLVENGELRVYEIGECDIPRSFPDMWCDRRICEGFWGDEKRAKHVVDILTVHGKPSTDAMKELLTDAAKLLDVAGMWKAPVDEQWRESYKDWSARYHLAKSEDE